MQMGFDVNDYEPVASRIARFWADHPNGAIYSDLVFDDGKRVVVKAEVWFNKTDARAAATDYAEEVITERGVNSTSRIENCCTSSQGRALSAAGYLSSDWTKKPSREEMNKVVRMTTTTSDDGVITERPANAPSEKQLWLLKKLMKDDGKLPPLDLAQWDKFKVSKAIEALKNNEQMPESAPPPPEEPF